MNKHPRRNPSWAVTALLSTSFVFACGGGDSNGAAPAGGADAGGSAGQIGQGGASGTGNTSGTGSSSGSGSGPSMENVQAIIAECRAADHNTCWNCCAEKLPQNDAQKVTWSFGEYTYECVCSDPAACYEQCAHDQQWCRGANSGGTPPPDGCSSCVGEQLNSPNSYCHNIARTQCLNDINCARKYCQSDCAPDVNACDHCAKYKDGWKDTPQNLCTQGSPSSLQLWQAVRDCMCKEESGCKDSCYVGCAEYGYSDGCHLCSKCNAVMSACSDDK